MKAHRALEMKSLWIVYGMMIFFCLIADYRTSGDLFSLWKKPSHIQGWLLFVGASICFFGTLVASLIKSVFKWTIEVQKQLSQVLTPLSYLHAIVLGLLSGFVEEWFFRGILMNHFGIALSSILYGLSHFSPRTIPWVFSKMISGAFYAVLYQATDSLLFVSILHSLSTTYLLLELNHFDARSKAFG